MYSKKNRLYKNEEILVDLLERIDKDELVDVIVDYCPNVTDFIRRIFRDYGILTTENCCDVAMILGDERKAVSLMYSKSADFDENERMYIYLTLLCMCYLDEAGGVHHSNRAVMMYRRLNLWVEDTEKRKYMISVVEEIMENVCRHSQWDMSQDRREDFFKKLYSFEDTREELVKAMGDFYFFKSIMADAESENK